MPSNITFLFLFVKRLHSSLNILSLVAVKKRKSGKNRKAIMPSKITFLFLFVKRLHSSLNIMSLVAVKKRKSGKNRKA